MQASNAPPDHPPGLCMPHMEPGGQSRTKVESVWKSNEFQRFRHPRRRFFMHFCAFWQLSKFNARCSVNLMFAKSLFSEICTQKTHFAHLGRPGEHPPGRKVLRSGCAVLHLAAKVERVWKSNQSRRDIPCLKVDWFCAKKSPAKSNWVWIMHFCFMIQVYTPYFCLFHMQYCCNQWHSIQSRTGFRGLRLIKSNGFKVELV